MLTEASSMNPGRWIEHSESAAENAHLIAEACRLDADAAFAMGLLHDIGRRVGRCDMLHIWAGYRYLMEQGFDDAAAVCLTHSFPVQRMDSFMGKIEISPEAYSFIENFITSRAYTEYDKLIQLCDSVSLVNGGILIEKRLFDVGVRYGVNEVAPIKWRATLELKRHFDALAGMNIYRLLPNIIENTFEW